MIWFIAVLKLHDFSFRWAPSRVLSAFLLSEKRFFVLLSIKKHSTIVNDFILCFVSCNVVRSYPRSELPCFLCVLRFLRYSASSFCLVPLELRFNRDRKFVTNLDYHPSGFKTHGRRSTKSNRPSKGRESNFKRWFNN
jgi:hypothetical protein